MRNLNLICIWICDTGVTRFYELENVLTMVQMDFKSKEVQIQSQNKRQTIFNQNENHLQRKWKKEKRKNIHRKANSSESQILLHKFCKNWLFRLVYRVNSALYEGHSHKMKCIFRHKIQCKTQPNRTFQMVGNNWCRCCSTVCTAFAHKNWHRSLCVL